VGHENWQAENKIQTIVSFEEPTLAHESKSIHTVVAVTDADDEQSGGDEQMTPLHGHQDDRLSDGDAPGHNTWIAFSIHRNSTKVRFHPTSSIERRVRRSSESTDVRNCLFARNFSSYPMLYAPPFERRRLADDI
jgi:hypothetical protein